jgi:hypothetical protein
MPPYQLLYVCMIVVACLTEQTQTLAPRFLNDDGLRTACAIGALSIITAIACNKSEEVSHCYSYLSSDKLNLYSAYQLLFSPSEDVIVIIVCY